MKAFYMSAEFFHPTGFKERGIRLSQWLGHLQMIQRAGKAVQVYYGPSHGDEADLFEEVEILCHELDPARLFIWAILEDVEEAEALVKHARKVCLGGRG